jgi:hypothetical protein
VPPDKGGGLDPHHWRGRGAPPERGGELKPHHRRGRGAPPESEGDLKPRHHTGEGSLNHTPGYERWAPSTSKERGGEIESRRRKNIAATLSANYCNYF